MKYIIELIFFMSLGFVLGMIFVSLNLKHVIIKYKYYILVLIILLIYVYNYTHLMVIYNMGVGEGVGGNEGGKSSVNFSIDGSITTRIITDLGILGVGSRAGANFAKQMPTIGGKLAGFAIGTGTVTLCGYLLKKAGPKIQNEGKEVLNQLLIDKHIDILKDLMYVNTLLMVSLVFLLNIFIVMLLKGNEDLILSKLPFIKKGSKLEKAIYKYIQFWIKSYKLTYIVVWSSMYLLLIVSKYVILIEIASYG